MIKPKKKSIIAHDILNLLKPKELLDPEADEGDITKARTQYEGLSDDEELYQTSEPRRSSVRMRNAPDLTLVDDRYRGEVVNRADLENTGDESSDDDDRMDNDTDDNLQDSDSDEEMDVDSEDDEGFGLGMDDDSVDEDDFDEPFSGDDEDIDTGEEEEQEEEEKWSDDEFLQLPQPEIIKPENIQERIDKADAVKNQLKIWEKLLEIRIKLQRVLTAVNTLPINETAFNLLQNDEYKTAIEQTSLKMVNLLRQLYTLRIALLSQHSESESIANDINEKCPILSTASDEQPDLDELDTELRSSLNAFKPYSHEVLKKWDQRVKLTVNPRQLKKTRDDDIVQRIEETLLEKDKLVKKTQIYRGGYEIIGNPITLPDPNEVKKVVVEGIEFKDENVYVPEIYDDSDFYHQLLRQLIEYKSDAAETSTELTQKLTELQRLRSKMKKKVDTRASKGRKIRYVVHNKLVNFMAPVEKSTWTEEAKQDLFRSLFDQALKPGASTSNGNEEKVDTLTYSGLRLL